MELEEYLGIFDLKKPGGNESFSFDYDALCHEIEKLSPPGVRGSEIVAKLDELNYLRVLPNGARTLTELGVAKRVPLPTRPVPAPIKSDPAAWKTFRSLCAYYADCVTFAEKSQTILFPDKINEAFIVPALGQGWIDSDKEIHLKPTWQQRPALTSMLWTQRRAEEGIFIGYPLSAWRGRNAPLCLSPVFLFPVELKRDARGEFSVRIHRDEVSLNQSWVEHNVERVERRGFNARIYSMASGNGCALDIREALQVVANRLREDFDPDLAGTDSLDRTGTQNNAVLFAGSALTYAKNLKRELKLIAEQPPEILDKTALAYVFRDPPLENAFSQKHSGVPVEFTPCNAEQIEAVRQGLTLPVSKVKGPPGTGKTYVAVNLMANLVFHNQSVLFTSKNHKAIDAIRDKAETVAGGFVRFCKSPDGSTDNPWWKVDLEELSGELDVARRRLGDPQKIKEINANIVRALEDFRDNEEKIAAVDEFRAKMQELSATRERIENHLFFECALPKERFSDEKFARDVALLASRLFDSERSRGIFRKILDALLRRKHRCTKAAAELRALVPALASEKYNSIATLKARARRLCEIFARYRECARELDELCPGGEAGEKLLQEKRDESDALMEFLSKAHKVLCAGNAKMAMTSRHASAIEKMSDADKNNWKNAQRFLDYTAEQQREMEVAFLAFLKFLPAWACTLLSLKNASPCFPAVFDRVVIDEAAQCDIPAIIPALFRARGLTIIGDEAQFPPVINLADARHGYLLRKHNLARIEYARFFYTKNTAYGIVNQPPVWLREHFRCAKEIVDYFGNEYYGGRLKVRTDPTRLNFPKNMGFRRAYEWRDVRDSSDGEIESVAELLEDLAKNNYTGTIGVISPLRRICDRLKTRLYDLQQCFARDKFDVNADVNTANGFQGGERDLIVFVLGWTSDLACGELWYINSPENKYIYNVAVSRARACLLIVGDRSCVARAQEPWLQRLVRPMRSRAEEIDPRSPGEKLLYDAMLKIGLAPNPQYPLVGRRLDLALVEEKIDVEVDGEAYHLNKFGERKPDDIWRDLQVRSAGWTVVRFWHREVVADADACARKVATMICRGNAEP